VDFDYISHLAHSNAAIVLEPGKEYLVESRLGSLAAKEGFCSLEQFIHKMRLSGNALSELHHKAIDALTTNETSFFRDFHPYEALRKKIVGDLIGRRQGRRELNIWSAACSTGQEPYSLAMMLLDNFQELHNWKISITATDISPTVLQIASEGSYTQFEVNRGLPASYLVKYFKRNDERWIVCDQIKKMVQFRPMNLISQWPLMPSMDLVMLRNVMIYFDPDTKRAILKKLRNVISGDGYLFLGSAETTLNLDESYTAERIDNAVAFRPVAR
jgi:chemotaxis protein methyltransferase CheR